MSTRITAGTGISLGAILALPAAAQADDFTVTNLNDDGAGSLRDAIGEAEANPGADRVLFQSKLSGTIELGEQLRIYSPVQVLGPGARKLAIDAPSRALVVYPGAGEEAVISGLTVNGGPGYNYGGAIFHGTGQLTISNSTITGGESIDGGGVYDRDIGDGLTVLNSTISGNSASRDGGGIFSGSDLTISNSTISGNSATEGAGINGGGGIWVDSEPAEIRSSTIAGNRAKYGGGIFSSRADVTLDGTVVADNTADDGADIFVDLGAYASFTASYTLIEDDAGFSVGGSNNLFGIDPALKSLANNGGPTDTHAIKKSPAKNAGPSDASGKDQRGAPRKGKADIGAYELTKCKGVVVNFVGTSGKDKLKGTKRKDGMLGLGGNDKLKGKKGKDGLCGGRGKDKLIGGPGKDKFNGGPGKDKEKQ